MTIEELLVTAKEIGASDLHVTVGIPPKVRLNGELLDLDYPTMGPVDMLKLIKPILGPHYEKVLEDNGEVDFSYQIPDVGRYRVNVFRQRGAYGLVARVIGNKIPRPEDLGIPQSVVDLANRKRGLVLVTGPTGSGKSTTLASIVNIINETYKSHIITLEDPIEYLHVHKNAIVNQREVGSDTMSFSGALRAALREDPDVILVGEMRDNDTIQIAITAAETGHLVFSTLHTTGSAATIDRIIDVFPPHQQQQIRIQLASVLESVISQQLIPINENRGRVAAFEVMHATPAVRNLIRENKTHMIDSTIQTSRKFGMQTMDDAIYDLYVARKITADRAIAFAQDPAAMQKKLYM